MTKMRIAPFAVGVVASMGAASAMQTETGTRLAPPASRGIQGVAMTERDQAVGAKQMAKCMFNRKNSLARQALLSTSKQAHDAALNKLKQDELQCFNMIPSNDLVEKRYVQIPQDILRGMLAEAALERATDQAEALRPVPIQPVYQRDWYAVTGRHVTVDEMGTCIADINPTGALALIRTAPTSKEEAAAFSELRENMGVCLRAGTKLQASRQALRAALADALFQRVYARVPTSAPTMATNQQAVTK